MLETCPGIKIRLILIFCRGIIIHCRGMTFKAREKRGSLFFPFFAAATLKAIAGARSLESQLQGTQPLTWIGLATLICLKANMPRAHPRKALFLFQSKNLRQGIRSISAKVRKIVSLILKQSLMRYQYSLDHPSPPPPLRLRHTGQPGRK